MGYNLNLLLLVCCGISLLFETINGVKTYQKIDKDSPKQYLHAINHAVLPPLQTSYAMHNSIVRYNYMDHFIKHQGFTNKETIKKTITNKVS